MDQDRFKVQWKNLRITGASYSSLSNWLEAISHLRDSGVSDEDITNLLRTFKDSKKNNEGIL